MTFPARTRALVVRIFCAVSATLFVLASIAAFAAEPLKLTILHMNDIHGHYLPYLSKGEAATIGGLARAATVISDVEKANQKEGRQTLFFEAGDLLMGTPLSTMFKGSLGITLLNAMGTTAMTIGNHEFDYGQDNLLETLKPMVRFPLLSANIKTDKGEYVFARSVQKTFPGSNVTALIFGLTTDQTPVTTHPRNVKGLVFEDPIKVAADIVKTAKPDDLVIAVTHIGFDQDQKLAQACPRINVIVGGHTHTELPTPIKLNDTVICQAGSYAKYIGRLDLVFSQGRVTEYKGSLILLDDHIKARQDSASIIDEHKKQLDDKLGVVIGTTEVTLDGRARWCAPGENTNFATLVGYVMATRSGTKAAVFNAGSIRQSVQPGNITPGDVYTALPFPNSVVTLNLTGADLAKILQQSADLEEGRGGKLQTYGIDYGVQDGKVKIDKIGGTDFDPQRVYAIATHDFLAAGGDGYATMKEKATDVYATAMPLSDLVVDFIKDKKALTKQMLDELKETQTH